MSESTPTGEPAETTPPTQPDDATESTDRLEGSYTEVDGEAPHVRGVAGAYTRTDGEADDESVVGDYVSTEEHPVTHDPSERHGKFVRADHGEPKPHPGLHRA